MGARAAVGGVLVIITMFIVVFMIETFVPISANIDFKDICRGYLIKMEYYSGLSSDDIYSLKDDLEKEGFTDVNIMAPYNAKGGDTIQLIVEGTYTHNSIVALFKRGERSYNMVYKRQVIARRIIN